MSTLPQLVIEPGRGVGPVSFGMTREEVADALARVGVRTYNRRDEHKDCYLDSALRVSFGDAGRVDFIEAASRLTGGLLFAGRDVFDTPADELIELVGRYDQPDPELGAGSHIYPNLILTLWRASMQADHKGGYKRPVFTAVGLGNPAYLAAIRAIVRKRQPG